MTSEEQARKAVHIRPPGPHDSYFRLYVGDELLSGSEFREAMEALEVDVVETVAAAFHRGETDLRRIADAMRLRADRVVADNPVPRLEAEVKRLQALALQILGECIEMPDSWRATRRREILGE